MAIIGRLKLKAQIFRGGEPAIGPGKADLLEAIDREGSISAAGRAMGMSYRRTWLLVDSLNRCWKARVVETIAGGGRDKGARLTPFGRTVLETYRAFEAKLAAVTDDVSYKTLISLIRDESQPDEP
ncbi:winged helix-turn-helix domain-containing protein [Sphingosinicella microcystinivorans]|uniref:winged helix-turn-helix domain-containing protein n=1 Tax=Sphingosinicella microcystinivorans TaxID=335406 RepID=UPI0022F38F1B|nr:LysR family transcriptional regulator [Sphingosinicella microcystinivorans]WBX84974.1 LysR family transcriptional regulator [Sphingosinicella microcystinivorans]